MANNSNSGTQGLYTCAEAYSEITVWTSIMLGIPLAMNMITCVLYFYLFFMFLSLKRTGEHVHSCTMWLGRSAVRVGLGPSAKKALLKFAKEKPELASLTQNIPD
ncbi:unnamed protein product [Bursaphelenchus xylophilus]|uniref:(pine wood nematode) hypothetical protein n=1 Tax=Bursaphelenchus xylophilus TaxID=6326 RepID=A0A1I7RXT8_BURXY|nr:unnamed protein product [Bursaphelenchus xylophilus]CAG9125154.1 unnamed protein product [Bursaphelenchus xylophilus]